MAGAKSFGRAWRAEIRGASLMASGRVPMNMRACFILSCLRHRLFSFGRGFHRYVGSVEALQ